MKKTKFNEKHIREAEDIGLELIGAGKNPNYKIYRIKGCGHLKEATPQHVRHFKVECKSCIEERYKKDAIKHGLELIGDGRDKRYRTYRFVGCGHTREFTTSAIRKGVFKCEECQKDKIEKEALSQGLEIIESGKSKGYRVYRFVNCGHIQEVQTTHVRDGNFACQVCEQSSKLRPSYVYLFHITNKDGETFLKLGSSNKPSSRKTKLGLGEDAVISLVSAINFETGSLAVEREMALHKKFKSYVLSKESAKRLGMKDGVTECYPVDMQQTILAAFDGIIKQNEVAA